MKTITTIFFTIIVVLMIFLALKLIIIPYENKANFKDRESIKDVWEGVDTTNIIGDRVDTCFCVIRGDTMYKVNAYKRIDYTYTPIKP